MNELEQRIAEAIKQNIGAEINEEGSAQITGQYWAATAIAKMVEDEIKKRSETVEVIDGHDEGYEEPDCEFCGTNTDDHALRCPNNNSPYAELIKNGYD